MLTRHRAREAEKILWDLRGWLDGDGDEEGATRIIIGLLGSLLDIITAVLLLSSSLLSLLLGHAGDVVCRLRTGGAGSTWSACFEGPNLEPCSAAAQPSRRCLQPQRRMSSRTDDRQPIQPRCLPPVPRAYRLLHGTTERMDRILGRAHSALIVFGGFYVLSVALLAIPLVQRQ